MPPEQGVQRAGARRGYAWLGSGPGPTLPGALGAARAGEATARRATLRRSGCWPRSLATRPGPDWPAGRCWHSVTCSGLPQRLRPGFWDNNGRCCGTAGVLALACDRHTEHADGLTFANVLVSDLAARATADADGARWSSYEHRASPGALAPRTGWAMGNAGIVRELLRYARIQEGRDPGYAIAWPDHPPAISQAYSRASSYLG